MASHEENKADRRAKIVSAAREIIRETGRTGLSMRSLAARAQVSLATPYNLFGSKQGVLDALLQENLEMFRLALSRSVSRDPIERIFDVVALAAEFYLADQKFYKALYLALFEAENVELRHLYSAGRQQFWESLVLDAIASHHIEAGVDPTALSRTLRYIFTGALHGWATAGIEPSGLEAELGYGVSLVLYASATEEARGRIQPRVMGYQQQILDASEAGDLAGFRRRAASTR
jgi:AcrR family transcriptional regulator